jgi:transposase
LEREGHDVLVANARRLRFIYDSDNKGDRTDAEALARVARLDPKLLNPIRHRGEAAQQHLAVVRARDVVAGARTALINHARGAVKAVGSRLPGCSAHSFADKVAGHVPPELQAALAPVLESIGELTVRIRAYDREIERLCAEHYPETERLRQVAAATRGSTSQTIPTKLC